MHEGTLKIQLQSAFWSIGQKLHLVHSALEGDDSQMIGLGVGQQFLDRLLAG